MGYEVKWTASAKSDFDSIIRHIAIVLDSPRAASEHFDTFISSVNTIAEHPEMHPIGTTPSLAHRSLRTCFIKNYVILYAYDGDVAIIHRIFHMRQDYARFIELGTD